MWLLKENQLVQLLSASDRHFVAPPRRRRREDEEDEEEGSRVRITPSFGNRTQPLFVKEATRGGAVRNLLFLNANRKDVAARAPLLLTDNA